MEPKFSFCTKHKMLTSQILHRVVGTNRAGELPAERGGRKGLWEFKEKRVHKCLSKFDLQEVRALLKADVALVA